MWQLIRAFVFDAASMILAATVLIISTRGAGAQNDSHTITNPCYTRENSTFARDLSSCRHYLYCKAEKGIRGVCNDDLKFDAEINYCVPHSERCFRCPRNGHYTESVPHACRQFMECWNGQHSLRVCPSGLVYDGRTEVRGCNRPPPNGGCYREIRGDDDVDRPLCPPINNNSITAVFLPDPNDCTR